ncbi:MAG: hypothetical protein LBK25_06310 [Treponema sp.]|nr:hypothetical protein [Treponema sp.]
MFWLYTAFVLGFAVGMKRNGVQRRSNPEATIRQERIQNCYTWLWLFTAFWRKSAVRMGRN